MQINTIFDQFSASDANNNYNNNNEKKNEYKLFGLQWATINCSYSVALYASVILTRWCASNMTKKYIGVV